MADYLNLQAFERWLDRADGAAEQLQPATEVVAKGLMDATQAKLWGDDLDRCLARSFESTNFPVKLSGPEKDRTDFSQLKVNSTNKAIELSGISVRQMELTSAHGPVSIKNARIGELKIINSDGPISLENCWIGTLIMLGENRFASFDFNRGCVLGLSTSIPGIPGPFNGAVQISASVHFPRKPGRFLKGPQPYRNMRSQMLRLENTPMVNRFFTLEQATERRLDRPWSFNRLISLAYEMLSDYGSSTARPALGLLLLFAISFAITWAVDGAEISDTADLVGWQRQMAYGGWCESAMRAFILTGHATFNPLSIFGVKGLVTARYWPLALWLWVDSVFSALLFALFFLAVRRRFKMT